MADITISMQQTNLSLQTELLQIKSSFDEQICETARKTSALNEMIEEQRDKIENISNELDFQYEWNIMSRFALKKAMDAPIKVVFLIEEPSVIKNVLYGSCLCVGHLVLFVQKLHCIKICAILYEIKQIDNGTDNHE